MRFVPEGYSQSTVSRPLRFLGATEVKRGKKKGRRLELGAKDPCREGEIGPAWRHESGCHLV